MYRFPSLVKILLLLYASVNIYGMHLDSLYLQISGNCSQLDTFTCRNSRCIPMKQRCDGINDCLDNTDEEDCDLHFCKEPEYFRCKNKNCISSGFLCDEEDDCGDFSDESNCGKSVDCLENEWKCPDNVCLAKSLLCDGHNDCIDGSDETIGCSFAENCTDFECKNKHCIPHEWVCDGVDDCGDNSDEIDCSKHKIHPNTCKLDNKMFLCSDNKTCISLDKVCDKKLDCPDKSDEGQLCEMNICQAYKCSHKCVMTPAGPKCICPEGFNRVNDLTCEDVDECQIYGICDQRCNNTPGSYDCLCDPKYYLMEDKRTCKAIMGESLMLFSLKTEIQGYFLESKHFERLLKNLKQAIGVDFDGHHIYWTDIYSDHESIYRAKEDGSDKELIITTGLGAPEDLALDWLTGNIYFTDSEYAHIGVCTNDGEHCTVLINKDVKKPRSIVLSPVDGSMYWSDWGQPAEIAKANMDGTDDFALVINDIGWPNGLALDYPNGRLYWVDAKMKKLESVKLDGSDRRIILQDVIKHPYAIAVFEDKLYWSDWSTHSIQSCNKFTGKNHTTILKEKQDVYGIHVYNSALKATRVSNPCREDSCSHICLLKGKDGYSCACPEDKKLSADNRTCTAVERKQTLIVGVNNLLLKVEHQLLGKHSIQLLSSVAKKIESLAYNPNDNKLYIYDATTKSITKMNLIDGVSFPGFVENNIDNLTSLSVDYFGNNLYWCDSEKRTVVVLNLKTNTRKVVVYDVGDEIPMALALVPEDGVMFVAFRKPEETNVHIDRFNMDGSGRIHVIEEGIIGSIVLKYDFDLNRVFWCDKSTGNIESTSVEGDDRHSFKSLFTSPVTMTFLKKDLLWMNEGSNKLYWSDKTNIGNEHNKHINLDLSVDYEDKIYLESITPRILPEHSCQRNNGNCSHFCLLSGKTIKCDCPIGMTLKSDNRTCYKPKTCKFDEFNCKKSDVCIPKEMWCNGRKDCEMGEDEIDCPDLNKCTLDEFKCENGKCIDRNFVCDKHNDCNDGSDERDCSNLSREGGSFCSKGYHRCENGRCITLMFLCDGISDCSDGSDEKNCQSKSCTQNMFQCSSGTCIPKEWECDRKYDCSDKSDEHSECLSKNCPEDKFTCNNRKCIDKDLVCDTVDDCGDFTDEKNCKRQEFSCKIEEEFQCTSNRSICIPSSSRCNGKPDCPHHEDEQDCSDCHVDEFVCSNKKCIPTKWLCDGINDCGDDSDEDKDLCTNQNKTTITFMFNVPCENGFRCSNGKCIDFKFVCNGVEDCYDGSDEHGLCDVACNKKVCENKCIATPVGAKCSCPKGYKLNGDGKTCSDILECGVEPPICSQLCKDYPGGYDCSCFEGFMLSNDRKSCKSLGEPMSLIFTTGNEIRKLSQVDNSLSRIFARDTPAITGLDIDVNLGDLYFSMDILGTIYKFNLNNFKEEHIENLGFPRFLSFDWINKNVYFADGVQIKMCSFVKRNCAQVTEVDVHHQINALAVDPVNKLIFYSTTHWWIFNTPTSFVYKCRLDGSKNEEVIKASKGHITGITFDLNKKIIYYVDQTKGTISAINYDGSNERVLFTNLKRPNGLNLFEDHLYYWTSSGFMGKCKLYWEYGDCDTFKVSALNGDLFVISQLSRQPIRERSPKENCLHLAVSVDNGVKCLCEDGSVVEENQPCAAKSVSIAKFSLKSENVVDSKKSGHALLIGILVPLLMMGAVVVTYYILSKRQSGQYNVRFHNPGYGLAENEDVKIVKELIKPGQHEYTNPIDVGSEELQTTTNNILQKLNPLVKIE